MELEDNATSEHTKIDQSEKCVTESNMPSYINEVVIQGSTNSQ